MAEQDSTHEEARGGRRHFFRLGLARMVKPLAGYIETHVDLTGLRLYLRPPGALPERRFLQTCYRCGNCVHACPVHAIQPLRGLDENLDGTPNIDPDVAACVACEGVECTRACPSGALRRLSDRRQIRMGLARVEHRICLRTMGEDCVICVEKCPIGDEAIRVGEAGRIEVIASGCVGCGTCQLYCPTRPKSIKVHIA
jgi:MauM/NapG family ferredoxin protein